MKEGGHMEGLGIDKKVLLIWIIKEKRWEVISWMYVDQDMARWQMVLDMVTNFQVP